MISLQLNITKQQEEPLLSRKLINATLEFDNATPSNKETISLIASNLKKDEKLISVRHIYTSFGNKKANVIAYVYTDEKKKILIEPKIKKQKESKPSEEKKEGQKPAETKKTEEKPKEEKKETKDAKPAPKQEKSAAEKKEAPKKTEVKKEAKEQKKGDKK
ncbi:hypothetical protein CMO83_01860 [Candidatus Woesearchaeota archaeon]|nr:hypothetical protein [Candidatus Woesearchaeota archaeon]